MADLSKTINEIIAQNQAGLSEAIAAGLPNETVGRGSKAIQVTNTFVGQARRSQELAAISGQASLADALVVAVSQTSGTLQRQLALFADGIANDFREKVDFLPANKRIASKAQAAVVGSYFNKVGTSTPARSRGRLRGRMRRALNDSQFMVVTPGSIGFANRDMLNKAAAHWRRLNYGASPAGAKAAPGRYPFTFAGGGVARANVGNASGFLQLPPNVAPAFRMPVGVFFIGPASGNQIAPFSRRRSGQNARGGNAKNRRAGGDNFYPLRLVPPNGNLDRSVALTRIARAGKRQGVAKFFTRGIVGYHFFDAGVKRIAAELPAEYVALAQRYAETQGVARITTESVTLR